MVLRLLDGEFSALPTYLLESSHGFWDLTSFLTDNTLSREVFPAFWRPIMVTSISVALSDPVSQHLSTERTATMSCTSDNSLADGQMVGFGSWRCGESLPEGSEQPVVHLAEEASHYAGQSWTSAVVLSCNTARKLSGIWITGESKTGKFKGQEM